VAREMALMRKTGVDRDLPDGQLVFKEQGCGPLHAPLDYVAMHWQPHRLTKCFFKLRNADARYRRQFVERKIPRQVLLNVGKHQAQLAAAEGDPLVPDLSYGAMSLHKANGQRGGEAIGIEAAGGLVRLHRGADGPPDVFDLDVARLKAIYDFDAAQHIGADADHQRLVLLH